MTYPIMGQADIIGGYSPDLQHMFGALAPIVGMETAQSVVQHLAAKNASALVDLQPTKSRRYPLGFPTTTVTAGGNAAVAAQPQIPFRGERLIVPSDFAGSLLITDIKIGKNSQLAAANPLPARAFTEFGWGTDLHLDTADISQFVTLNLTSTSGHDISFNAVILGRAVE
jgi:hypothetical protein